MKKLVRKREMLMIKSRNIEDPFGIYYLGQIKAYDEALETMAEVLLEE